MSALLEGLFNGISIGSVLLLAALGLAIVFGLMGVINLAHGELMMLGAYSTFVVQNIFKGFGSPLFDTYVLFALPIAFLVSGLAGLLLERGVIRFLYGRPLETLLATWGVSLILQQFVRSVNGLLIISLIVFCLLFFGAMTVLSRRLDWERIRNLAIGITLPLSLAIAGLLGYLLSFNTVLARPWFSARNVDVTAPVWLRGGLPLPGFQMPYTRLFIIILTAICLLGTYWFLNKSSWGLRIRAVTQNRPMSSCLGIPTNQVDALTFALGSGLAGVAGCAISFLGSVGPNVGQNYIVDTFMVVVVGGVGNLLGTIIAAMAIGVANYLIGSGTFALIFGSVAALKPLTDFFTFFSTTSMAKVMIFALIIAFLQFKPAGIFPPKGRTAEL
ncbi:MAG: branched-chain amino acid ABC transporter permease [Microcystis aeruginosa Ma_QC_Ch_20071001_S25]|uniref:Branched-chain amino acid ABC transporter permease n=1 Tax=Microcystis aeruginosa Ma_QC_Ch_20071001_S25D TaxID=2486250 RepID=A0A552FZX3_MICAE|nr:MULTISPECIES: branched-chain amino acid ABC transporter permease [unclassified Microcystis]MCA2761582.1 branched-chain amino acid ABC transporter permease [Microcystis sp. M151S2]NCR57797.1 branched-chain amino acid ABC transporter permease [Microcystis aeruginosa LL13-06]TRU45359.1 MAG: branched-chain amino acid ABC transporter permease [Microcystis aeruginosa Ma_QC_Ch_20071001_S25]TRU52290.1 MAG: branched-chain amino acid ABC transporter permease [Microcystis aeruginosa Ma_QC_Ch_20071001_S